MEHSNTELAYFFTSLPDIFRYDFKILYTTTKYKPIDQEIEHQPGNNVLYLPTMIEHIFFWPRNVSVWYLLGLTSSKLG